MTVGILMPVDATNDQWLALLGLPDVTPATPTRRCTSVDVIVFDSDDLETDLPPLVRITPDGQVARRER